MDTPLSYQVIFSGKLREGFTQPQVMQALVAQLKLPPAQLERLFSGTPQLLKRTDSPEEAKKLVAQLSGIGAIARIKTNRAAKPKREPTTTPRPAAELAKFSPFPRGGRLVAALTLAATTEVIFALLYLLLLLACSVGLIYSNLFTTWAAQFIGFAPLAVVVQLLVLLPGLLLLFLLAKPLLSWRQYQRQGIVLNATQEPDLHAFVEDVCERIGAPLPDEIRINNDVAVELGYLQGPRGFLLNRTVLTLGAPLLAATDTSQLAALIAQSLQLLHSKSLSPRAAFLLRRVDRWLQQAIYEQDALDRQLDELSNEPGLFAVMARALQRLIALSRQAMGGYLHLTRRLNRRLFHRLVADADKVALVFTGSSGFARLIEQQRLLAFASQSILPGLQERWRQQGTLPDNLVQALVLQCRQYPPSIHPQLRALQEQEKLANHDPIPADSQRLYRVSKKAVAAAYPCHSPATGLFRNFSKLARTMTVRIYHNRLGIPVSPNRLEPTQGPDIEARQQQQLIDAMFQQLHYPFTPLKLRHRMKMVGDYEDGLAQHHEAREATGPARSHAELALRRCLESEQALIDISTQEVIYRAQLWRQWGVEPVSQEGLEQIHRACREQEKGLDENIGLLTLQLTPYVQRLAASLALLNTPQAGVVNNANALHDEVNSLIEALERVEQSGVQLRNLRLHTTLLLTLLSFDGGHHGKLHDRIQEQAGEIRQQLTGLGATLKTTPYPFGTAHDNLMAFALSNAYPDEGPGGDFDRGNEVVEQLIRIERQILARLCAIALHVEKTLGL
jgi:hypothetical protein